MLTNADLGELLETTARDEQDHRRRALQRAARASRFWPEEAADLVAAGRSPTELPSVGPWIAERLQAWLDDPPPIPEPDSAERTPFVWICSTSCWRP